MAPAGGGTRPRSALHLGWCRGWLGAALAALRSMPAGSPIAPEDASRFRRIAQNVIDFGVEGPLCLCHGALGHLEFLSAASERGVLDHPETTRLGAGACWRA